MLREVMVAMGALVLVQGCKGDDAAKAPTSASAVPPPAPTPTVTASAAASGPGELDKAFAEQLVAHARKGPVLKKVPDVPDAPSDRPKPAEWLEAPIVNTQGGGHPTDCYVHMLRDWIRVDCLGDIVGTENMEAFGIPGMDHVLKLVKGSYASLMVRTLPSKSPKIRMCFGDHRDSLFVGRPSAKKPAHVALAQGPECDGGAWGSGFVQPSN